MKVLVFGAAGQVGSDIIRTAQRLGIDTVACTRKEVDITQQGSIQYAIERHAPTIVINAAAFTAVERAETERQLTTQVNTYAPGQMATICADLHIPFLHLSTDYVFDGDQTAPYSETDMVHPINHYGQTKWAGEQAIRAALEQHIIVRTSWLFGESGNNFVQAIIRRIKTSEPLRVVNDQWGCPTPASRLAEAIIHIAQSIEIKNKAHWGTYHYCGTPPTSWYAFAQDIVTQLQRAGRQNLPPVNPITTVEYPSLAKRPKQSALQCQKIYEQFGIQQPSWRDELVKIMRHDPMN